MAYGRWSSRRYRRYRKYRRFYRSYRRGYTPYSRKYVNASSRSSVRMKTVVDATSSYTAGHGASATGATVGTIFPLMGNNISLSAANSPLYRTYCSLYEECKIIGCKVSVAVVSEVSGGR